MLEFTFVRVAAGEPITDPAVYYSVRNENWFLLLKLIYSTVIAMGGGWLAAAIAGRRAALIGLGLAIVHTISMVTSVVDPDLGPTLPLGMWIIVMMLTAGGIMAGARIRGRREASSDQPAERDA